MKVKLKKEFFSVITLIVFAVLAVGSFEVDENSKEYKEAKEKLEKEGFFEYKETIASGAAAAARGGYTTVCCMPNTEPALDNKASINYIKNIYCFLQRGFDGNGLLYKFPVRYSFNGFKIIIN